MTSEMAAASRTQTKKDICSFCDKDKDHKDVKAIITGSRGAAICDGCIVVASSQIIEVHTRKIAGLIGEVKERRAMNAYLQHTTEVRKLARVVGADGETQENSAH